MFARTLVVVLWTVALLLGCLWAMAALWIDGPASRLLAGLLVGGFVVAAGSLFFGARTRSRGRWLVSLLFLFVLAWWFSLAPSNDRLWDASVAHTPRATLDGDILTIENLRNFQYRSETDFDEVWEERTYDLSRLTGVDLFLSYWTSPYIAHTIMSWTFEEAPPLAISIETRRETGEVYSAVRGFFRQFELYYVVADERDLVGLRTGFRDEEVFLYPLRLGREAARELLLDYVRRINEIADEPAWYNAATHNCTTTIRHHMQAIGFNNPWDIRFLINGQLDELAYELGSIDTRLPFAELRERSNVVEAANASLTAPDFSARIREGLPSRRGRDGELYPHP